MQPNVTDAKISQQIFQTNLDNANFELFGKHQICIKLIEPVMEF